VQIIKQWLVPRFGVIRLEAMNKCAVYQYKADRLVLEELPRNGRHVIPQINAVSLSRSFANTLRRANLNGSIHCLRHTYCSHLAMAGIPLRTIQKLAGHTHFKTTERYAHLAPGHLQNAANAINL